MPLDPEIPHEIERKFLVKDLPADLEKYPSRAIEQGYLAAKRDGTQVRLRRAGPVWSLTVKRGDGLARHEWEIEVTQSQFDVLWPATQGRRLRKTRYDVPFGTFTIEVDIYEGSNAGLIVAEVEFGDEEECHRFEPPNWVGRDVSGKPRYSNVRLATE
jgi:adenylate cyclase